MRKIKFRGRSVNSRMWFYGYLQEYVKQYISRLCVCSVNVKTLSEALMFEVSSNTVGQFTGMLDKNGKEIYEGDIIYDSTLPKRGAVSWIEGAGFNYEARVSDANGNIIGEVIGNIHENPELLEDKYGYYTPNNH